MSRIRQGGGLARKGERRQIQANMPEDVSNPAPNKTPRGYIFQDLCLSQPCRALTWKIRQRDRPIHQVEHLPKKSKHAAVTFDCKLKILCGLCEVTPHLLHQLPQYVRVGNGEKNQHGSGDRGTDNASDSLEGSELGTDSGRCCSDDDGSDDDDAALVRLRS